mgnify:CR=1 FL=1
MKSKRQEKILELIAQYAIETQEELLERLSECGIPSTQATVSRDIKQLHLYKEPCGGGRYRYASSARSTGCDFNDRLQRILRECSLSVDCAQNLVVLKTMPGLASAAGAAFDASQYEVTVTFDAMDDLPAMIGCVCGDDTVLVVMRDEASAQSFCEELSGLCK